MMVADFYLARYDTRLKAYNALQMALMRCFLERGGSIDEWCTRYAAAFRRRYGGMLGN